MGFDMTEYANRTLSNVHVGGDMTEPKTGADVIPDATLDERLDVLGAELERLVAEAHNLYNEYREMYLKAMDMHTAFLLLRNSSVKVTVVEPETDDYKDNTEGSPETEPGKDKL